MSAKIRLPGGPVAEMGDDGKWSCAHGEHADFLNEISKAYEARGYLPDPFKDRLDVVIAETGARLLEYHPPAAEWKEGRIY
jgi:hypothetical protein